MRSATQPVACLPFGCCFFGIVCANGEKEPARSMRRTLIIAIRMPRVSALSPDRILGLTSVDVTIRYCTVP